MFSFLMCVNKMVPYIDEAINSMLHQEYADEYGICIIANNCDEELWGYLKDKNIHSGGRIRLYRTGIGQLAFNLNYGLNLTNAMYVVRMDADDVSEPNRLAELDKVIRANNFPDVVGSAAIIIDENGKVLSKSKPPVTDQIIKNRLPFRNPFIHPSTTIKVSSLVETKGYANGLNSEDYDLWLRMARAGCVFMNTELPLLRYRINPYQIKGSRLAYAESCGYMIREFLITGSIKYLAGFFFGVLKFIIKWPSSN